MVLDRSTSRLLTTLYSAPMQPELWEVFLAELGHDCRVSKAALLAHDFKYQEHTISVCFGDSVKESVRDYETHYYQFDEWTSRCQKVISPGRILEGEEIWPEELFQKSVFYNEFLRQFDVCKLAAVPLSQSSRLLEVLSFYRSLSEGPFESEQLATLHTILPHLQTALAIRRRFLTLESKISDLENALDRIGTAIVLLDANAKAIIANRAARQIFDQRNGLEVSEAHVSAQNPNENAKLRSLIAKAISAGQRRSAEHGGSLLVSRLDRRPLQVLVAPFVSQLPAAPKKAVAVVFISDPERKPASQSEVLRELYGLTQAETRVAISLLDGKSLPEIADSNGVGHETVRSQIKSVLNKTGTMRQGELIRLLSMLPSSEL